MDFLSRSHSDREALAETVARRLDPAMSVLGLIFALVVLVETLATPRGALGVAFSVAGWVLWSLFVIEFLARLAIAPSIAGFLKRNWWQLFFLLVPFLRILRVLRAARLARAGRLVSSGVRAGRGAGRVLSGRLAWLSSVTIIVVLVASQLIYEFGPYRSYADALFEASLAAVTGQPLSKPEGWARLITLGLGVYSVAVFASLAAMLGAYFLGRETGGAEPVRSSINTRPPRRLH